MQETSWGYLSSKQHQFTTRTEALHVTKNRLNIFFGNLKSLCYHQYDHQNHNHHQVIYGQHLNTLWLFPVFTISVTASFSFILRFPKLHCKSEIPWSILDNDAAVSPSRDLGLICLQS